MPVPSEGQIVKISGDGDYRVGDETARPIEVIKHRNVAVVGVAALVATVNESVVRVRNSISDVRGPIDSFTSRTAVAKVAPYVVTRPIMVDEVDGGETEMLTSVHCSKMAPVAPGIISDGHVPNEKDALIVLEDFGEED